MGFSQHSVNPRAARPTGFQPGDEFLHLLRLAAGKHFHAAVVQITGIAGQSQLQRFPLCRIAKPYACLLYTSDAADE